MTDRTVASPAAGEVRTSAGGVAGVTFSVVICVYTERRWQEIVAAVASVAAQRVPAAETIIVSDHNSALAERIRRELPGVTVVENDGQQGLSDARNTGVKSASASVVAFLDDDARADPEWLAALARCYADDRVLGVGGSAAPVWREGRRPGWFPEEFDWVIGCSYRGQPTSTGVVRNFLGCNMSFRRSAFELAGGFDPAVGRVGTRPIGGEETEFCIRLRRVHPSAMLIYEPAALVHHSVPADRATWAYFRSRCFSEGISKAMVSRLAGAGAGLASERRHAVVILPVGVLREVRDAIANRDADGVRRAAAIIGGLAVTTAGYAIGALRLRMSRHRAQPPSFPDRGG